MAAQDDAAREREVEVLPLRLDALEDPPVEPLGETLHRRARMRRLDLDLLSDKNLQPRGGAMERIAFRHARKPTIRECAGLSSACGGGSGLRSRSWPRRRRRSSSRSSRTARRTRFAATASRSRCTDARAAAKKPPSALGSEFRDLRLGYARRRPQLERDAVTAALAGNRSARGTRTAASTSRRPVPRRRARRESRGFPTSPRRSTPSTAKRSARA